MKIQGQITFLIDREQTTIDIVCKDSRINILQIILTPEQLSSALSRIGHTPCEIDFNEKDIDKVGKRHENMKFDFAIPEEMASSKNADELQKLAQSKISNGWIADNYFGSQDPFFKKDGKQYARCTVCRWV